MNNLNLNELSSNILKEDDLGKIAPNFKKGILDNGEVEKIIRLTANDIDITEKEALIGIMLLMLKGAASGGTPQTLAVELKGGKTIAKRNVMGAYYAVTGNNYIRRLAETLAINIGEFAEKFNLNGELAQRINTALKAEKGESLNTKELAWCSSFSQNIPDLQERSSERLVRLLAEDYKKRFENKKKVDTNKLLKNNKGKKNKK